MVARVAQSNGGPLERLRAGEIDLETYIDLKVEEATAHLDRLPAPELARVRAILRARIAEEPELQEWVKRAGR
jgi:hypothetical protein